MRSERGTAEQTALARDREQSGKAEREAGMTNYTSRLSVGDRLPRWICISPEPGRMGKSVGKTNTHFLFLNASDEAKHCGILEELIY